MSASHFPSDQEERRRAVRIDQPGLAVVVRIKGREIHPSVQDMSTLGIGLGLDFVPQEEAADISFLNPEVLNGLKMKALKRHVRQLEGANHFQVGYEFVFTSRQQQDLLLRWLSIHLSNTQAAYPSTESRKTPSFSTAFYSDPLEGIEIRFPTSQEEFEQAMNLIPRLTVHHALMQTKFFIVLHKKNPIGAVSLVADTLPFKLTADELFPAHLKSLRASGKIIGEISLPYFKEDNLLKNPSTSQLRKLKILFAIFPHILSYAKDFAHFTDLVALAPPHLEEFYHLWLFKELGPEAKIVERRSGEMKKGFRLMWLNLKGIENSLSKERSELSLTFEQLEKSPAFPKIYQESYFPNSEILKKWFCEKNALLQGLPPNQAAYFESLVPGLKM